MMEISPIVSKKCDCMFVLKVNLMIIPFLIFSSCGNPKPDISIDLNTDIPMSVFDMFSEVRIISLETTSESLISRISQVEYFEGNYYIFDSTSQQIFIFSEEGDFRFKISARGKGPGEYLHLSHFAIDKKRKQLVLMDPPVQLVHVFDLKGQHVETMSVPGEVVMGYSDLFVLNDTIILLTSVTNEYLSFYNRKEKKVIARDYFMKEFLQAFLPMNVYQLNGKTYVIPPLSQQVMEVSQIVPDSSFTWCFGKNNNTRQQIDRLLGELESRKYDPRSFFQFPHEGVGPGKFLNHHILKTGETDRFKIVLVEYDNDYKNVVIDKRTGKTHVFTNFNEGINLIFSEIKQDRVIAYDVPMSEYFMEDGEPELIHRTHQGYQRSVLDEDAKRIVANHDPMNQNPFLVVYTFRK